MASLSVRTSSFLINICILWPPKISSVHNNGDDADFNLLKSKMSVTMYLGFHGNLVAPYVVKCMVTVFLLGERAILMSNSQNLFDLKISVHMALELYIDF